MARSLRLSQRPRLLECSGHVAADASIPSLEQILDFCAEDPVERVFLEDVARRGLGRFSAVEARRPARRRSATSARTSSRRDAAAAPSRASRRASRARMLIGEERAVGELWEAASARHARRRVRIGPASPSTCIDEPPEPGETGLREATTRDLDLLVPACAQAHFEELGVDPLRRDPEGFRWRTQAQIDEGRSWIWVEGETILFKAEASAWTPNAVQLQQVWVDPSVRGRGYGAARAARPLPPAARADARPSASSCAPTTRPGSARTSRSGCADDLYRSLIF